MESLFPPVHHRLCAFLYLVYVSLSHTFSLSPLFSSSVIPSFLTYYRNYPGLCTSRCGFRRGDENICAPPRYRVASPAMIVAQISCQCSIIRDRLLYKPIRFLGYGYCSQELPVYRICPLDWGREYDPVNFVLALERLVREYGNLSKRCDAKVFQ